MKVIIYCFRGKCEKVLSPTKFNSTYNSLPFIHQVIHYPHGLNMIILMFTLVDFHYKITKCLICHRCIYILYIFGLTHYAIVHLLLKPVNQSSWRSKKMFSGKRLFTVELHSVYWLVSISSVLTLEVIQVTYQKYLWNQRVLKLYVPII